MFVCNYIHSFFVLNCSFRSNQVTTTAGRQISEREKFDPLLRWNNKTKTPFKDILLRYHTPDMLGFISSFVAHDPSCSSSSSNTVAGSKRVLENGSQNLIVQTTTGIIDLTSDDGKTTQFDSSGKCDKHGDHDADDDDDEVCIIEAVPKIISVVDMSNCDDDEENEEGIREKKIRLSIGS